MVAHLKPDVQELLYNDSLPIDEIIVGERRRKEYGDIQELADSIKQRGLLHPIIVDAENNLIAGGRRLRACQLLGWTKIPVRAYGTLSDDERDLIELEENLRRLDLSPGEKDGAIKRSKAIVQLAEVAARVNENENKTRSQSERVSGVRGPQPEPTSLRQVAKRIGIAPTKIHEAKKHVEVTDKYKVTETLNTSQAIRAAEKLDAMPGPQRQEIIKEIESGNQDLLADLAELPPLPSGPTPKERADKDPGVKWTKGLYQVWVMINSIRTHGGMKGLIKGWKPKMQEQYLKDIRKMKAELTQWEKSIEEALKNGARSK